jgi:hypothetical protein
MHAARMVEIKEHKILVKKYERKIVFGRLCCRSENNIKMDLLNTEWTAFISLTDRLFTTAVSSSFIHLRKKRIALLSHLPFKIFKRIVEGL